MNDQIKCERVRWHLAQIDRVSGERKRTFGTTSVMSCRGALDRVKLAVLMHVDKDGKSNSCPVRISTVERVVG